MGARLLLLLLLVPGAAAQTLVLHVDEVPDPASGIVDLAGAIEVPDGAMTNTWVDIIHEEATLRLPARAEATAPGMGGTSHPWNATWNTTRLPDGNHTLRLQAHSGDGRSSAEELLHLRTDNGNWARLLGANVTYSPVGLAGLEVRGRFHVESGFLPGAVSLQMDGHRTMWANPTIAPRGGGTYDVNLTWQVTRPTSGTAPIVQDVGLILQRGMMHVQAQGTAQVIIEPWEPETRVQYGPERNATLVPPGRALPPELAIAAGGGAVVLALLAAGSTEAGRLGMVGLFSRIRGPRVLDHATRARLHQAVSQRPGLRFRSLRKELGLPTGTLVHHLRVLEREGLVRRVRDGGRVFLYPGGAPVGIELHPLAYALWQALARDPQARPAALAPAWGITRQGLHHHLGRLRELDLVSPGGPPWRVRPPKGYCRNCHWLGAQERCIRCGAST